MGRSVVGIFQNLFDDFLRDGFVNIGFWKNRPSFTNDFRYIHNLDSLLANFPDASSDGILVEPSSLGAELFLWGYGEGRQELSYALNADALVDLTDVPLILDGVAAANTDSR